MEWIGSLCQRSSLALPAKQDSYHFYLKAPLGKNLSQGLGLSGGGEGTLREKRWKGSWPFENDIYIFFLFMSVCFNFFSFTVFYKRGDLGVHAH